MIVFSHVLHTSRPIEIEDTIETLKKTYQRVLNVKEINVTMTEKLNEAGEVDFSPCTERETPHVHYAVTIGYDETDKPQEAVDKT